MGSRICARSSAHTERHRLTSWWPVALMGVIAGSAEKWSKAKQRKRCGTPLWNSSIWMIPTIIESLLQQCPAVVPARKVYWCWRTSRQRHQAARDSGTSWPPLSPRSSFCWDVPLPKFNCWDFYWTWKRTYMRLTQISPNTTRRTMHTWLVIHGSMYRGANTALAWRAPNFKPNPGKTRSTRVTKVWMTSGLTRWIKH